MTAQTPDAILQETKRRMHASVEALKKGAQIYTKN